MYEYMRHRKAKEYRSEVSEMGCEESECIDGFEWKER